MIRKISPQGNKLVLFVALQAVSGDTTAKHLHCYTRNTPKIFLSQNQ